MQVILGIIVGVIVAFIYKSFFGKDVLDEAEARNVELARQLKEALDENKSLRKTNEHNNIVLLNKNKEKTQVIKNLQNKIVDLENNIELLTNNTKNKKIKELVQECQSKN